VPYLDIISFHYGSEEEEADETMVLVSFECETNVSVIVIWNSLAFWDNARTFSRTQVKINKMNDRTSIVCIEEVMLECLVEKNG